MLKTNILAVDDEIFNLETLKRTFRKDYNVFTASSGSEGLDIISNEEIHIVISDQRMPVMTGTEFLKSVARKQPDTIRIILTAYTDVIDLIEAINSGLVYKYVTKPWQPQDFRMTIQRAADHYWAEEERRKLLVQLQEQNIRLENQNVELKHLDGLKSRFMSIASHEFRTPLAIISGSVELLSMITDNLTEKQANLVNNALEGSGRLNEILTSVFDLVKMDASEYAIKFSSHSINKLIKKVYKEYEKAAGKRNITIKQNIDDFSMEVDPDSIVTVFDKLLSNAIKFTPDGGTVELLKLDDESGMIHLVVKDSGIGIPGKELDLIFDKFHQLGEVDQHSTSKTNFKGGGTGLGLAICKGIITLHRGKVYALSEGKDKGTEIHILLPKEHKSAFADLKIDSLTDYKS